MRLITKASLIGAFLCLIVVFAFQNYTGMWLPFNTVVSVLAAGLLALAIVMDFKLFWEFFTMRTTKHGMNMGAMIAVVLAFLVCVNYLANLHNKTWDVTQEKLNSLSEQSAKVLAGLKSDLEIKIFYMGPRGADERNQIKKNLQLFQGASSRLKVRYLNAYEEQEEAIRYLKDQPDQNNVQAMAFVEYNGKRIRIQHPFDEGAITSALIKATREGDIKVYFVKGHGERDISGKHEQGLSDLAQALADASVKAESLDLIDKKEIPADAGVVAIIGPSVPYLDKELEWLRDYVKRGGRLLVAIDPGQRHNLANLVKPLGVEFENNFVISGTQIMGMGPMAALGRTFDLGSDITKSLPSGVSYAVFPIVSEVRAAPGASPSIKASEVVKTDERSFTVNDLSSKPKERPQTKPVTLAVEAEGTMDPADKEAKKFSVVVFGDSDFVTNAGFNFGVNRDLALNTIAKLSNQSDLISIRPKLPKGTVLTMTKIAGRVIVILGYGIPVVLLLTSLVVWLRRRGA